MLYMVMHKADDAIDSHWNPDPELVATMGNLVGEAIKKGIFLNGAGLKRSQERVRVSVVGGKATTAPGFPKSDNQLLTGFVMLKVHSMDEAVEWAKKLATVTGTDVEVEVGPVVEPWDLGMMPKPENAPLRVLALPKATPGYEAGTPTSPDVKAKMSALIQEMQAAGVFLAAESLRPSSRGARLRTSGGRHTWTDGPFAEAKELVAGFSLMKFDTLAEVKEFTDRYADILGDIEVDVREILTD